MPLQAAQAEWKWDWIRPARKAHQHLATQQSIPGAVDGNQLQAQEPTEAAVPVVCQKGGVVQLKLTVAGLARLHKDAAANGVSRAACSLLACQVLSNGRFPATC